MKKKIDIKKNKNPKILLSGQIDKDLMVGERNSTKESKNSSDFEFLLKYNLSVLKKTKMQTGSILICIKRIISKSMLNFLKIEKYINIKGECLSGSKS